MKNKGLNYIYGIIATALALLSLLFGGYLLVPIFGEKGVFLGSALIAIVGIMLTLVSKTSFKEVLPFKLPSIKKFFGAFLMFIGVTMFNSSLSLIIGRLFDPEIRNAQIDSILLGMNPILAIFLIAVIPAVCEEFFCRGFLVKCFSSIKNEKALIAVIAIIFGALHLDLYSFFPTAIMGAFFCYVTLKTESLIIPMIFHFANNALSTVLTYVTAGDVSTDSINIFKVSPGVSIGMSILYLGIALFPFFCGLRLFKGQKVFHFKSYIALLVAVGCVNVGSILLTVFSYSFVSADAVTVIAKANEQSIDLGINESGDYTVVSYIYSDDEFIVEIQCGEEVVYRGEKTNAVTLYESFENRGGDCKMILRFDKGENYNESTVICYYGIVKYLGIK